MEIIIFLLIAYGISNIMIFSSIFKFWRVFWGRYSPNFLGELFTCMICLPFWVGIFLSVFIYPLSLNVFNLEPSPMLNFMDGCLTSGGVWLIHTMQEKLEK